MTRIQTLSFTWHADPPSSPAGDFGWQVYPGPKPEKIVRSKSLSGCPGIKYNLFVRNQEFRNIRFVDFNVPRNKFLETFLHSFYSTVHSLFQHYDIVHYHNTGPGFFIPLLMLRRPKIVFTYHNVSYTQKKWNFFAKKCKDSNCEWTIRICSYKLNSTDGFLMGKGSEIWSKLIVSSFRTL